MTGRALVLGGTGLLGPEVCHALLATGAEVLAFNRGNRPDRLPAGVGLLRGDRRRSGDLRQLARAGADVVVDTAGWFAETLPEILESLLGRVRLYVFISSIAVYREGGGGPLAEDAPLGAHPVWGDLGLVKRRCEEAVAAAAARGLRAVILRLAHLCSADPAGREGRLAALLRAGREVPVPDDGAARLQLVDVRDVARLVLRLAAAGPRLSPCYNVAAGETWTIRSWIEEASRRTGLQAELRFIPFKPQERQRFLYWPGDVVIDPGKLARELRFRPRAPRFPAPEEIRHEESDPQLPLRPGEDRYDLRPAVAAQLRTEPAGAPGEPADRHPAGQRP